MAMTLEEAKRLTNKRLAEQRKGYLAENAYRQSPEGIKKDKDRMKAIGEGILSFTPVATVQDGSSMVDNIQKGNYQDATVDGLSAALGLTGLKPIAKMAGSAFKGLKGLFAGPLSPQYNSKGALVKAIVNQFFDHPLNQTIRKNKPEFKDLDIYYTGQKPAVAKQMQEGKTKGDVYFSDNPEVAKVYAGPDGVVMGFGAQTPIGGKRSIIDKNMGYAGGQTQYILSPEEAIEFMKNPKAGPMPFSIFSNPQLTRR